MNFDILFDNFDLLLNSSDQITKLNQAILQLAVQGKLVPQDPTDEPVTELLKQIKAEKEKLIREKKIVKGKPNALISSNGIPYELPESWKWCRLEDLFYPISIRGKQLETKNYNKDGRLPIIGQGKEYITGYSDFEENVIKVDTHVIVFGDHTREIKYVDFDFIAGADGIKILNPFKPIYEKYFYYVLKSYIVESRGYARHYNRLIKKLFPLPPLNEQKRIVTKIEDLLSKTQEIEVQLRQADQEIVDLNKAALNHFLDAKDADEFYEGWRFILANFDLLYSDERNISDLKHAILQLAVQGKLLPQDPTDEPAIELLKRIRAEKLQLMREKKVKKEKPLPPISPDDVSYELPEDWIWVRLGELVKVVEYGTSQKASFNANGVPILGMNNIKDGEVIYNNFKYIPSSIRDLPRLYLKKNDLLFNRTNSYELVGKTGVYKKEDNSFTFASYLIRVSFFQDFTDPDFINFYFNTPACRKTQIESYITQQTGQANFNDTKLKNVVIPLPPLNEQKRIVAKVDGLMNLCDELEEQIRQSKEESERLMQAVLREAFEGKYSEEPSQEVSAA